MPSIAMINVGMKDHGQSSLLASILRRQISQFRAAIDIKHQCWYSLAASGVRDSVSKKLRYSWYCENMYSTHARWVIDYSCSTLACKSTENEGVCLDLFLLVSSSQRFRLYPDWQLSAQMLSFCESVTNDRNDSWDDGDEHKYSLLPWDGSLTTDGW